MFGQPDTQCKRLIHHPAAEFRIDDPIGIHQHELCVLGALLPYGRVDIQPYPMGQASWTTGDSRFSRSIRQAQCRRNTGGKQSGVAAFPGRGSCPDNGPRAIYGNFGRPRQCVPHTPGGVCVAPELSSRTLPSGSFGASGCASFHFLGSATEKMPNFVLFIKHRYQ